jgi:diguanylate cyclase (GGDEF)-like protein
MTSEKIQNDDPTKLRLLDDIPVPYAVFRALFDSSRHRVVNTRYLYVNDAYCRMAGRQREELIDREFLELYPSRDIWFPYCQQALEENRTVHACFYSEEAKHWLDFTVGPASGKDNVAFIFTNVDESVLKSRRDKNTDNIILLISKLLNNEENYEESMNHALEQLSVFIHPDRLYVLETDGKTVSNTFEWCAEGVTPEIQTLQDLNYKEYLGGWEKYLEKSPSVIIADIEELKDDDLVDYENLKRQGIHRLAAAPFYDNGKLIGYLGADNYEQNDLVNTQAVLTSISYFIGAKIVNHRLMEDLNRLSRTDILTGVFNRNAMIGKIAELAGHHIPVGLIYADVNNLKNTNDTEGHGAGDQALRDTAGKLVSQFGKENVYRAGGDEFVVMIPEIAQEAFGAEYKAFLEKLGGQKPMQFSSGAYWCSDSRGIEEALRVADQQMYGQKRNFYERSGFDRRRN